MAKAAAKPTGPEFVDCEQRDETWFEARLGIPTASNFGTVMATGDDGTSAGSLTRTKLLHILAGERLSGQPAEHFRTAAMDRGLALEPEARERYEKVKKVQVIRVGFVRNFTGLKRCGASPDGLVGFDRGLEIKTMRPDLMIPLLMKGAAMPPGFRAQVQGNIWVCERDCWDFMIYWRGMPDFIVHVDRDEKYIKDLSDQVERFNHDLNTLVDKLKRMGA